MIDKKILKRKRKEKENPHFMRWFTVQLPCNIYTQELKVKMPIPKEIKQGAYKNAVRRRNKKNQERVK